MKKPLFLSIVFLSVFTPFLASADKITELGASIKSINTSIVAATATLFMALAMAAFFFGMAKFILASREGELKEINNGKQFMLWSVIALFVMFSIYGIIRWVQGTIGLPDSSSIIIPTFQIGGATKPSGGDGLTPPIGGLTPTGGGGGPTGSCTPNTVCYSCSGGACICDGSSTCVRDYGVGTGVSSGSYGGSCNSTADCSSGLSCVNTDLDSKTCRCPGNFVWSGGSCNDPADLYNP